MSKVEKTIQINNYIAINNMYYESAWKNFDDNDQQLLMTISILIHAPR